VFPELDMSTTEFDAIVKKAKNHADYSNEGLGEQLSSRQSILLIGLLTNPQIPKECIIERFIEYDKEHLELFKNNLPIIYSDATREVLKTLKTIGVGVNISCNTSFISGDLLDIAFERLGLDEYISFKVYSDRINCSKPCPTFFRNVIMGINVPTGLVLHVGDNSYSDGGSGNIGIDFLHINGDSNKTILDVLTWTTH
jgi:FMN phosphatase YigB (HAD superfamily)